MGSDVGREQRAAAGVPWLGLLLWMCACAALFVSLIMRADDLDRDRRVAASSAAVEHLLNRAHAAPALTGPLNRAHAVPALTGQGGGLSVFTARQPPAR